MRLLNDPTRGSLLLGTLIGISLIGCAVVGKPFYFIAFLIGGYTAAWAYSMRTGRPIDEILRGNNPGLGGELSGDSASGRARGFGGHGGIGGGGPGPDAGAGGGGG